ncbi:hypothetical protein, partial [Kingella potus]|uniref:hypothetical protein n=1 Tax=Kingella potus TaxID=265175 RepID=UPI003D260157
FLKSDLTAPCGTALNQSAIMCLAHLLKLCFLRALLFTLPVADEMFQAMPVPADNFDCFPYLSLCFI